MKREEIKAERIGETEAEIEVMKREEIEVERKKRMEQGERMEEGRVQEENINTKNQCPTMLESLMA